MTLNALRSTPARLAEPTLIEVPRSDAKCTGRAKNGQPCRAVAILPSGLCISHDPAQEDKRNMARSKGGAHTSRRWRLERSLKDNPSLAGVIAVLGEVTEGVKDGTVPAAVGNSVASLSRALVSAIEAAQSGEKLRSLEELLDQLTQEKSPAEAQTGGSPSL